jgi:hypothetical protein
VVKASRAGLGALAELFEHIEKFLRRLETYINVPPTPELQEVIVKVMAEVLSVLAVATRVIEQGAISELKPVMDNCCWLTHVKERLSLSSWDILILMMRCVG